MDSRQGFLLFLNGKDFSALVSLDEGNCTMGEAKGKEEEGRKDG